MSTISVADIQSRKKSHQSLMPDNFGELFDDQQFADLVGFLLKSSIVTE
jgi:hypothetical protein